MRRLATAIVFGLLLATTAAWGARITDQLLAGFYANPDSTSQPLKVLPSGTPVEVLENKGEFARVRLGDNSEGWVERRFITDAKPAKVQLLELQARHGALQRELAQARRELKQLRGGTPAVQALEQTLAATREELARLRRQQPDSEADTDQTQAADPGLERLEQRLIELEAQNELLRERMSEAAALLGAAPPDADQAQQAPAGFTLHPWHLPLLALLLLVAFLAGIAFKNYRMARRYGSFRF
jgi:SH3 domain protein